MALLNFRKKTDDADAVSPNVAAFLENYSIR